MEKRKKKRIIKKKRKHRRINRNLELTIKIGLFLICVAGGIFGAYNDKRRCKTG